MEQGGLLLGTRSPAGSVLYDARPLPRALRTPGAFHPLRWRPPPDLRQDVVGWFHSHPGRGVHLSRADARVHHHLFPRGDGLALVVDARSAPQPSGASLRDAPAALGPPHLDLALYGGSPLRAVEALQVL